MPPPGYVAAGAGSPIRPSAGLSKAMIALYWGTTAASFLLAFAFFRRKSVFDDFINGEAGFSKLDDADTFVGTAALLQVALTIAAVSHKPCCPSSVTAGNPSRATSSATIGYGRPHQPLWTVSPTRSRRAREN